MEGSVIAPGQKKRILKTNRHRQRSQPLGHTLWSKEVWTKNSDTAVWSGITEQSRNPLIRKVPTPLVSIWCCMGIRSGRYHSSAGRARLLTSFEEVFSFLLFFKDHMVLKPLPCLLSSAMSYHCMCFVFESRLYSLYNLHCLYVGYINSMCKSYIISSPP